MYAPKFISWMSDEERFHSALEVRIAPMLKSARAECKAMVYLAELSLGLRPPLGLPPPSAQIKYNAIADQLIQYNRKDQTFYLGANPLSVLGAANPYGAENNYNIRQFWL